MLGGGYAPPPSRDAPWLRRTVVPSHCRSDVPTFSVARAEDYRAKAQDRERKPSTTELKLKTGERNPTDVQRSQAEDHKAEAPNRELKPSITKLKLKAGSPRQQAAELKPKTAVEKPTAAELKTKSAGLKPPGHNANNPK